MSGFATIRAMIAMGLSDEQKLELLAAMEEDAKPKDHTAAARQQRRRDKVKAERDESRRDVTRDDGSPDEDTSTPSAEVIPNEASASLPIRQPVAEAMGFWNENAAAVGWRTISKLSPARHKALSCRLREHGLEGWRAGITRARASPYLGGTDPPSWFAFDWLTKAGNFLKLIEGNYDRRNTDDRDPTTVALQRFTGHIGAGA